MPLLKKGEYMRQYDVQKKRVYKILDFFGWNQLSIRAKYILSFFFGGVYVLLCLGYIALVCIYAIGLEVRSV